MKLIRQNVARLTLPAGKSDYIVFDDALPGFGLRLRAGGKRAWVVQYRVGSKQRRVTLGNLEALDADVARKAAKEILAKAQLGSDPQTEKAEYRAGAAVTLGAVTRQYLELRAKPNLKARSYEEVSRHLTRHWAPLKELPIKRVQRATVAARLGEIAKENGRFAANRARASLSTLFTWAMGEGLVDTNPVIGTNRATNEIKRDRVLTDAELRAVWQACRDDDHGRIVRLLILTAQRREEVGGMAWTEFNAETELWSIPRERTKNGRPHDVPLSAEALALFRAAPARDGRPLVFGDGEGGFQGWSNAKAALDRRIAESGATVRPWRLHDLRRTAATRMGDLGVLPHVIEALLNHISGHKAGVAGIYNRATYAREKREALDSWASYVSALMSSVAPPNAIAPGAHR
ncbi:tyrosine-type recombinase/integrase [Bosea sp. NBC_00550]|uniref:tyrosine-type recombinase/integrase n=1 Tax=Bosea sp. NBC_00550 TaxID=2969621 RepID=UPI0022323BB6|nr:site-specific integrase [Bosea sp. NBC_00550]UZF90645.1 tyrosine-type recombinase/integrase [Bosea sp. NBC_00550]